MKKFLFFIFYFVSIGYSWQVWDLYQIYDDFDKDILLERGYKMYEFKTLSRKEYGDSWISKHDVFYDWYNAHIILSDSTLEHSQRLEIGDYLRNEFSKFTLWKKVNGFSYMFRSAEVGNLYFVGSRVSSPGSRGKEIEEKKSDILLGARYQRDLGDLKLGLSFANMHKEDYSSPDYGIFRFYQDAEDFISALYLRIADSDILDGDGGQIFEIEFNTYDSSGTLIKKIHFHTPAQSGDEDNESDYLYINTGSIDVDHRFADLNSQIVYKFNVTFNTRKIYLIIKTSGTEKLIQISHNMINYTTIPSKIFPDNNYINLILNYSENSTPFLLYDDIVTLGNTATYDDNLKTSDVNFNLKNLIEAYNVLGNIVYGIDIDGDIEIPLMGEISISANFANSIEKRIYSSGKKDVKGYAGRLFAEKNINTEIGFFTFTGGGWFVENNFIADSFVDSYATYNKIDFYPEWEPVGEALNRSIDFNYNGIPDYLEDFYALSSAFPLFLKSYDDNFNGVIDELEITDKPDYYGYDAGYYGLETSLYFSPSLNWEFQIGYRHRKNENNKKELNHSYFKFGYEKDINLLFNFRLFDRISRVKKEYWIDEKGLIDGFDNNNNGSIDEPEEASSIISNEKLYTSIVENRLITEFSVKRLKSGLSGKFGIANRYVLNTENNKRRVENGETLLIDYLIKINRLNVTPFFKLDFTHRITSPYQPEIELFNYFIENYGILSSYNLVKSWDLKCGYLKRKVNFKLNTKNNTEDVILTEIVGNPTLGARRINLKLGYKHTKVRINSIEDLQSQFFLKLYFVM